MLENIFRNLDSSLGIGPILQFVVSETWLQLDGKGRLYKSNKIICILYILCSIHIAEHPNSRKR